MQQSKNETCLATYYDAFRRRDYVMMGQCYHPGATFQDEVFGPLNQVETAAMWEMLLKKAQDFTLKYEAPSVVEEKGAGKATAFYTFSKTGRRVENIISSEFTFKNGKIFTQKDQFDFWRWSRQALGMPGLLLGFLPFFKDKVKEEAKNSLKVFLNR